MLMWSLYLDLYLTETLSTSRKVVSSIPGRSDVQVRDISLCNKAFRWLATDCYFFLRVLRSSPLIWMTASMLLKYF